MLATQLDRLQKYAAADTEKKPKLNKLGTQEWNKTKSKVHGAVEEVAKDLVALYAARQKEKGYQFGPDTVWQREFEEMFPYEETQDQLTAIEDTKRDIYFVGISNKFSSVLYRLEYMCFLEKLADGLSYGHNRVLGGNIRLRRSHSNSIGNKREKDTAGCCALNRKDIVIEGY